MRNHRGRILILYLLSLLDVFSTVLADWYRVWWGETRNFRNVVLVTEDRGESVSQY